MPILSRSGSYRSAVAPELRRTRQPAVPRDAGDPLTQLGHKRSPATSIEDRMRTVRA